MKKLNLKKEPFILNTIFDVVGLSVLLYFFYHGIFEAVGYWVLAPWTILLGIVLARGMFLFTSIVLLKHIEELKKLMLNTHAMISLIKKINRIFPNQLFEYKISLLKDQLVKMRHTVRKLNITVTLFWISRYKTNGFSRCLNSIIEIEQDIHSINSAMREIMKESIVVTRDDF